MTENQMILLCHEMTQEILGEEREGRKGLSREMLGSSQAAGTGFFLIAGFPLSPNHHQNCVEVSGGENKQIGCIWEWELKSTHSRGVWKGFSNE